MCEHPAKVKCEECRGSGRVDHYCDCPLCERDDEICQNCEGFGHAMSDPDARPVLAFGVVVDAQFVSYVIEHAPRCEAYTVEIVKDADTSDRGSSGLVRIVGDSWIGGVGGMVVNEKTKAATAERGEVLEVSHEAV